ncbi:hypothetical protein OsJ_27441 [Oryza sativa Japonica Group]|uniref:Uncharacterized protein n=1 Tax=Oryza sativa subsp. japonica TaxID=39947 RepID=B9G133_ORYSJ|nr:hypothetical protein OsJ_27441 [Oryza sativa Japonica Group]
MPNGERKGWCRGGDRTGMKGVVVVGGASICPEPPRRWGVPRSSPREEAGRGEEGVVVGGGLICRATTPLREEAGDGEGGGCGRWRLDLPCAATPPREEAGHGEGGGGGCRSGGA